MNFLACASNKSDGLSSSTSVIKEGDCVIVYEGIDTMKAVYVSNKGRYESRFGIFKHQSWIGKSFGSKVTADAGAGGWIFLLRPTPELWTQVLRHRTQILYIADISMVVTQLELSPGGVVLESGTGSGSLTHSLIRAVAPAGHVHTFEFHAGRAEDAAAEFKQHGLSDFVTVTQRNIEEQGFPDTLHGKADAVFLDLPAPYKVVPSAASCLKPNGRFCSFSPCIEQIQRTSEALSAAGFTDLITYECLVREYEVHRETLVTNLQLAEGPLFKRRRTEQQQQTTAAAAAGPAAEAAAGAAATAAVSAAVAGAAASGLGAGAAEAGAEAEPSKEEGPAAAGEAGKEGRAEGSVDGPLEAGPSGASGGGEGGAAAAADGGDEAKPPPASSSKEAEVERGKDDPPRQQQQQQRRQQQQQQQQRAAGPLAVQRIVGFRPSLEARGHTGYLLFARKFVCG